MWTAEDDVAELRQPRGVGARLGCLAAALLLIASVPAQAAAPDELAALNQKLGNYSREQRLLHARLTPDSLGRIDPSTQRLWDARLHSGGKPMLVHLWSVSCGPCVHELPALRQIIEHLQRETPLRVVFISEDLPEALTSFFKREPKERLPKVEYWLSGPGSGLRIDLQDNAQPMTLLLDGELVVRQAMVGLLSERRNELYSSASRLLRNLAPRSRS